MLSLDNSVSNRYNRRTVVIGPELINYGKNRETIPFRNVVINGELNVGDQAGGACKLKYLKPSVKGLTNDSSDWGGAFNESSTDPCIHNSDNTTLNGIFNSGENHDVNKVDWGFNVEGSRVGINVKLKDGTTKIEWGTKAPSGVVLDEPNPTSTNFDTDDTVWGFTVETSKGIKLENYCSIDLDSTITVPENLEQYLDKLNVNSVSKSAQSPFNIRRLAMEKHEAKTFKADRRRSTGKNSFELFVGTKGFLRQPSVSNNDQLSFNNKRLAMEKHEAKTFKVAQRRLTGKTSF